MIKRQNTPMYNEKSIYWTIYFIFSGCISSTVIRLIFISQQFFKETIDESTTTVLLFLLLFARMISFFTSPFIFKKFKNRTTLYFSIISLIIA